VRYLVYIIVLTFFIGCFAEQPEPKGPKYIMQECEKKKPCPKAPSCKKCETAKACKPITIYKEYKKLILGEVEEVYLSAYNISLEARIDTGAQTSSIHAKNIVSFERDGKKWVRFTILDNDKKEIELKKPVVKTIKVKRHGQYAQDRFVVHMRMNISNLSHYIEVSLNNREDYKYLVLIGRNFLRGNAIVDVSLKHTHPAIREDK